MRNATDTTTLHYITLHYITSDMVASIMWDFPSSRCVWKHERDSLFLTILPQFFNRLGVTLHYITLHYITLHYIALHYITLHYITLHYITLHYTMLVIFCRQSSHPNCILTWPANHLSTGSLDIVCDSFAIHNMHGTWWQRTYITYITLHYITPCWSYFVDNAPTQTASLPGQQITCRRVLWTLFVIVLQFDIWVQQVCNSQCAWKMMTADITFTLHYITLDMVAIFCQRVLSTKNMRRNEEQNREGGEGYTKPWERRKTALPRKFSDPEIFSSKSNSFASLPPPPPTFPPQSSSFITSLLTSIIFCRQLSPRY